MNHKPQGGYVPPANAEAEQSVLGAILVRPEALDTVADLIVPGDFYRKDHGLIYKAMLDLYGKGKPVDLVTVNALLKERGQLEGVGGPVFLAELSEQVGFATNAEYYAGLVRDKAILRRLLDASQQIARACLAPVENVSALINDAESKLFQVAANQKTQAKSLADLIPVEEVKIEALHARKDQLIGLSTGFRDIDKLTAGLQDSDLIILAARPSMGKTALALNIAFNTAYKSKPPVPVAFFSLEMSESQLTRRLIASAGKINAERLRTGQMEPEEWVQFNKTNQMLIEVPIFIHDASSPTVLEIRSHARRLKMRHGIRLIIVDYLQLIQGRAGLSSREQQISEISRSLKALAKELQVPIIALSQLSREVEKREKKRPQLSDLRESGAIEQDADLVLFIFRGEVYHPGDLSIRGIAELNLAKQRNGATGTTTLTYLGEFTRFENHFRLQAGQDDHSQG
jgi:replicative DNA helicase